MTPAEFISDLNDTLAQREAYKALFVAQQQQQNVIQDYGVSNKGLTDKESQILEMLLKSDKLMSAPGISQDLLLKTMQRSYIQFFNEQMANQSIESISRIVERLEGIAQKSDAVKTFISALNADKKIVAANIMVHTLESAPQDASMNPIVQKLSQDPEISEWLDQTFDKFAEVRQTAALANDDTRCQITDQMKSQIEEQKAKIKQSIKQQKDQDLDNDSDNKPPTPKK